jgi:hypothetical protein
MCSGIKAVTREEAMLVLVLPIPALFCLAGLGIMRRTEVRCTRSEESAAAHA